MNSSKDVLLSGTAVPNEFSLHSPVSTRNIDIDLSQRFERELETEDLAAEDDLLSRIR